MLTKSLLTMSLLAPLAVQSATAEAGSMITDKSYWPSEARRTTDISESRPSLAFAYAPSQRLQAATRPTAAGPKWRYQGGPKSGQVVVGNYRYCIQGDDFGAGDCSFSTYQQCQATASGRTAYCGVNLSFSNAAQTERVRSHRHR